jgi:hypothetical protein
MQRRAIVLSATLGVLCLCVLVMFVFKVLEMRPVDSVVPKPDCPPEVGGVAAGGSPRRQAVRPILPGPRLSRQLVEEAPLVPEANSSIPDVVSGRVGRFEAVIKAEVSDPVWSGTVSAAVRTAYQKSTGASVDSVECGESICRLELALASVDDDDLEDVRKGMATMNLPTGWQAFRLSSPPEPPRAVIYLARENAELPRPSQ